VHHGGCTHRIVKAGLGTGCVCGHLTAVCLVPEFEITRSGHRAGVHSAVGCDVHGWYARRRELVGMARRPQPTSTTAASLALDHIGDHDKVYVCSGCHQEFSQVRHCHAHRSKAGTARVGGSYQRAGASCAAAYPMTPSTLRMTHGARSRPTIYLTCSVLCAVSLQESQISCASCGFVAVKHHTAVGLRPGCTTSIQVVAPVGKQAVLSTPPLGQSRLQFGAEFTVTLCTSVAST